MEGSWVVSAAEEGSWVVNAAEEDQASAEATSGVIVRVSAVSEAGSGSASASGSCIWSTVTGGTGICRGIRMGIWVGVWPSLWSTLVVEGGWAVGAAGRDQALTENAGHAVGQVTVCRSALVMCGWVGVWPGIWTALAVEGGWVVSAAEEGSWVVSDAEEDQALIEKAGHAVGQAGDVWASEPAVNICL